MTNPWTQKGIGGTATLLSIGLIALSPESVAKRLTQLDVRPNQVRWVAQQEPSTAGNHVDFLTRTYATIDQSFEADLAAAYDEFSRRQKRLDSDLAVILTSNLWDLYAR